MTIPQAIIAGAVIIAGAIIGSRFAPSYQMATFTSGGSAVWRINAISGDVDVCTDGTSAQTGCFPIEKLADRAR
jgi:hypothetical protein